MPNFSIRSTSVKGNFELLQEKKLLYKLEYKNWFSGEAIASFDGNNYKIKPGNFWQTTFEIFRNDMLTGKLSFNWKGEIVINYTNTNGTENEMLFRHNGILKLRFVLANQQSEELLAMISSGSILKYHYEVSVGEDLFAENEMKELLMMCGYSANLLLSTMASGL